MIRRTHKIDQLIINSPYDEPAMYWSYDRPSRLFTRAEGRRPAGYVVATPGSKSFDDPGVFVPLPLVNQIRPRVQAWRESGYLGATGITQRLLEHWRNLDERDYRRFFFCQLEAIETLIWLAEASPAERQGIVLPGDGGPFPRLCSKMATGSGKTIVMAMLIAWQVLNKAADPQNPRYAKHVFIVAPGLTVKSRLAVLVPDSPGNYYEEFNIVPPGLADMLRQGKVLVRNWHALNWESDEHLAKKKSVDKRGAKSDEAYAREVLGELATSRNLLVINDEAHHAWRVPIASKVKGVSKHELDEATKWVGGLDRIHRARGILACHDLTATPFAPSGKQSSEEALFGWIVSDFGLNDAIESGLVKTPRVVVRDDSGVYDADYRSRLYHIYNDDEVKDDLNRKAEPQEPLPDLVTNAYYLLGKDWLETAESWSGAGHTAPPVMITVANRTETAARVKYAFDRGRIKIEELCQPARTLHIDSKVLASAEQRDDAATINGHAAADDDDEPDADPGGADSGDDEPDSDEPDAGGQRPLRKMTKDQQAELLRRMVDTVGRPGEPGENIQNVISVGMLSEGWDAKTVTHIMGLRAFSSQLLCEQVVGRGLRRTSYDVNPDTGLFEAEYVNIFGVPFTFLPHEGGEDGPPPPPPSFKTRIEPVPAKRQYEITWPNVVRIEHVYQPRLVLDLAAIAPLEINAYKLVFTAEMAPLLEGKPDVTRLSEIELHELAGQYRLQRLVFAAAVEVYDQMRPTWRGSREYLLAQVVGIVERFLRSDRIKLVPASYESEELRKRLVLALSITRIVQHVMQEIREQNTLSLRPVFDREHPIRSTGDMPVWHTGKPNHAAARSHINYCVFDSTWEASEAYELDHSEHVAAWVKNGHLGFEILYTFDGIVRKYRPDFLVRLTSGKMLVLEVKGQDTPRDQAKRQFLDEWVQAVNSQGGFGRWASGVVRLPKEIRGVLAGHAP